MFFFFWGGGGYSDTPERRRQQSIRALSLAGKGATIRWRWGAAFRGRRFQPEKVVMSHIGNISSQKRAYTSQTGSVTKWMGAITGERGAGNQ